MKPEVMVIIGVFVAFIVLEILFTSFFNKRGEQKGDGLFELVSGGSLVLFTQPLIILMAGWLAGLLMPNWVGLISDWSFWSVFLLFIIFDDLSQYWWHRLSHNVPWLYNLHRPHHNAEYLSIRVVYRNNFFYYLFMPGIKLNGFRHSCGLLSALFQRQRHTRRIMESTLQMTILITKAITGIYYSFGMCCLARQR